MFVWVFEPWDQDIVQHQVSESSGPPLTIYQEKFHLPNQVIKLRPLLGNWPTD